MREIAAALEGRRPQVELNIEGDPRPDWIDLVHEVRPDQATLVPVIAGEITSQVGWRPEMGAATLRGIVHDLKSQGIRVSLFVDPTRDAVRFAADTGGDRIELYTEPFARAFEQGPEAASRAYRNFVDAAEHAHALGLGVNAGHDLDLDNLTLFRELPHLDEVSIGHALISRAVFQGLEAVVREYLAVLAGRGQPRP